MAKKGKRWQPGVPVAEYELQDGGLLSVPGDQRKLCSCPFCEYIMRRHIMVAHLRARIIADLRDDMCMCRALQVSHHVRDLGGNPEKLLQQYCQEQRLSRTSVILEYGDPRSWE